MEKHGASGKLRDQNTFKSTFVIAGPDTKIQPTHTEKFVVEHRNEADSRNTYFRKVNPPRFPTESAKVQKVPNCMQYGQMEFAPTVKPTTVPLRRGVTAANRNRAIGNVHGHNFTADFTPEKPRRMKSKAAVHGSSQMSMTLAVKGHENNWEPNNRNNMVEGL